MPKSGRWQPHQVRALTLGWERSLSAQLDPNHYPVSFVIRGNHEDPNGNAVPYERTTQRSKHVDLRVKRYKDWKLFVQQTFSAQTHHGFPCHPDGFYRLDIRCFLTGERHGDGENIRKGIQDALFIYGDKHVFGTIYPIYHVEHSPRVEVVIDKLPLLEIAEIDAASR
jgi:hypothetical protein